MLFVAACEQLRYQLLYTPLWSHLFQYTLYIILALSLAYIILTGHLIRNKWILLLLLLIGYELAITVFFGSAANIREILQDLLTWPLLSIVFCVHFRRHQIPDYFSKITVIGMVAICLLSIPNITEHLRSYGRFGAVIGPVYFVFAFLPLVYLTCSKKTAYLFSALATAIMLISTKRLGFLIVIFGIAASYLSEAYILGNIRKRIKETWKRIVLLLLVAVVGFILMERYNAGILDRLASLSGDGGSGRAKIWETVIENYNRSSFFRKIFGHGCHAVNYEMSFSGRHLYAHNSFLETLYDYGVVGLMLIIYLTFMLIRRVFELHKNSSVLAPVLVFTVPIIIGMGVFGYFFEQTNIIIPVCATWGICMSADARNRDDLFTGKRTKKHKG